MIRREGEKEEKEERGDELAIHIDVNDDKEVEQASCILCAWGVGNGRERIRVKEEGEKGEGLHRAVGGRALLCALCS